MLYTCDRCGKTRADQIIDPANNLAVCPECGFSRSFKRLSLLAVGGASGTGKTALCKAIAGKIDGVVALDGDILWRVGRYSPEKTQEFYEDALRIAMNIAQSGLTAAIFHAGFGVPDNLENCVARRYFSDVHYLGLWCSDEELEKRLSARPNVRRDAGRGFIEGMKGFNRFFRFYDSSDGEPAMDKIDTSALTLEETAHQVCAWIRKNKT